MCDSMLMYCTYASAVMSEWRGMTTGGKPDNVAVLRAFVRTKVRYLRVYAHRHTHAYVTTPYIGRSYVEQCTWYN